MADVNEQADAECERILGYAKRLANSGIKSIYKNKIREIKGIKYLKESDKIKIIESCGIEVKGTENIEKWLPPLMDDIILNLISEKIALLKQQRDANGQVPQNINNIYDFIAYISNDMVNVETYSKKNLDDLRDLVTAKISKYVNATNDYAHAWTDLCTIATNKILDSDEHRRTYDNSLKFVIIRDKLSEEAKFFTNSDKRLPIIADGCISEIGKEGYSQQESIALYNKIVGLIKIDPYIPEDNIIFIKCGKCGSLNKFNSISEAENSDCKYCKKQLYTVCPSSGCSKRTPISSDYCVHCNFFIAGIKNFNIYYQKAINAIAEFDLTEAKKQLSNAKLANPKDPRLQLLDRKIKDESVGVEKYFLDLDRLITEKRLMAAQKFIFDTRKENPKINLSKYESEIKKILADFQRLLNDSKRLDRQKQIETCKHIINECSDHREAINMLISLPPRPCGEINCYPDEQNISVNVTWSSSPDKDVKYTLVRKNCGIAPLSPGDKGVKQIVRDTRQMSYNDTDIISCQEYTYSVFAKWAVLDKNAEVFSVRRSKNTILYQDVSNIRHISDNAYGIIISWDIPLNCQSVRIYRKENSIPSVSDRNAGKIFEGLCGSFNDKNLKTNCVYGYRVQAVYSVFGGEKISQGQTFIHKRGEKLTPLDIIVSNNRLRFTVEWNNIKSGYTIRIVELKSNKSISKDSIIKVSDIKNFGETIIYVPSENGNVTFTVDPNRCFDVAAFAYYSNDAIASNTEMINTYLPVTLASRDVRVDGNNLVFKLSEPIPNEAQFICYGLKDAEPYWTEASELSVYSKVSIENCRKRKNELIIKNNHELSGVCYLTLYTQYLINGKLILSSPERNRIRIPMHITVKYGVKSKRGRNSLELSINVQVVKGNVSELPPFDLVYLNGTTGNNKTVIATTDKIYINGNHKDYKQVFDDVTLPSGNVRMKIVPTKENLMKDLSISPFNWFSGKI